MAATKGFLNLRQEQAIRKISPAPLFQRGELIPIEGRNKSGWQLLFEKPNRLQITMTAGAIVWSVLGLVLGEFFSASLEPLFGKEGKGRFLMQ